MQSIARKLIVFAAIAALVACGGKGYFPEVVNSTKTESEYKADVSSCYKGFIKAYYNNEGSDEAVAAGMANTASGAAMGAAAGNMLGSAAAGAGAGAMAAVVTPTESMSSIDKKIHTYLDWCMTQKGYEVKKSCHNGVEVVPCSGFIETTPEEPTTQPTNGKPDDDRIG